MLNRRIYILVMLLMSAGMISPSFAAARCVDLIRGSIYGRISPELRPKVLTTLERLMGTLNGDRFSGATASVFIEALAGTSASVVELGIPALSRELDVIEKALAENQAFQSQLRTVAQFSLASPKIPVAGRRAVNRRQSDFLYKWQDPEFRSATANLQTGLNLNRDRSLAMRIMVAADFAIYLNDERLIGRIFNVVFHSQPLSVTIDMAALSSNDRFLINIARYVLGNTLRADETSWTADVQAVLYGLARVRATGARAVARELLFDFAAQMIRPDYLNIHPVSSFTINYGLLALYYCGQEAELSVSEQDSPEPRYEKHSAAVRGLAREYLQYAKHVRDRKPQLMSTVFLVLQALGDKDLADEFARDLLLSPTVDEDECGKTFVTAARLLYLSGDAAGAVATAQRLFSQYCRDIPNFSEKARQFLGVAVEAQDPAAIRWLIGEIDNQAASVIGPLSPIEGERLEAIRTAARAVVAQPTARALIEHRHPGYFWPPSVRPWLVEAVRLEGLADEIRHRLFHGDFFSNERITAAGREHFAEARLQEAADCFIRANYRQGLIDVADKLRESSRPEDLQMAIDLYTLASRLPITAPFSSN
jgi:hypothetical protein